MDKAEKTASIIMLQLEKLMKAKGLNSNELSKITGIPQPTIYRLLHKHSNDPRFSTLRQLAEYFEVPTDYFLGKASSEHSSLAIPVFDINAFNHHAVAHATAVSTLVASCPNKQCYGIHSTYAMSPVIALNSVLVINPKEQGSDGDLVLVYFDPENQYAIRRYLIDGPEHYYCTLSNNEATSKSSRQQAVGTVIQITTLL